MQQAIVGVTGSSGLVSVRITHIYPDGTALYLTVVAAGRPGSELAMWDALKTTATETVKSASATVTITTASDGITGGVTTRSGRTCSRVPWPRRGPYSTRQGSSTLGC